MRPAGATEGFGYLWREGPVTVRWNEGNGGERDAAVRGLVGHWKRLAVSAWAPSQEPLRLDVSLYGPSMGSGPPHVRLSAGGRTEEALAAGQVDSPLAVGDVGFLAALTRLTSVVPRPALQARRLADDGWPRLSPDGRWCAFRTWRSGRPEVWLASVDGQQVERCVLPRSRPDASAGRLPVVGELIDAGPDWSPDGRALLWVQGGRLCLVDVPAGAGRILTPADAFVRAYAWSPNSRHAVIDFEDGRLAILDRERQITVPFHTLLPQFVAAGDYAWSPSGRRLLFRGQGGVSSANFRRTSAVERLIHRAIDAATGRRPRAAPPLVVGDYRDRLALYDLAAQRVTTVPLEPWLENNAELRRAAWSASEDRVSIAARSTGDGVVIWTLKTDPLVLATTTPIRQASGPLEILGWRDLPGGDAVPGKRLAVLLGEELLLLDSGSGSATSRSKTLMRLALTAGPDGGYRGVEEEEEATEAEPVAWLAIEEVGQGGAAAAVIRFDDGIYAALVAGGPLSRALQARVKQGGVVDLDLRPAAGVAVAAVSPEGGVGELVALDRTGDERSLTRDLDAASVTTLALREAPFTAMGPRSGAAELASAFRPSDGRQSIVLLALVVLAGALVFWRRARRARGR